MDKGKLDFDERGLIFEAYRIDGIVAQECRSIFLDWALGASGKGDMQNFMQILMEEYGNANPDHPMTAVIREGLEREARPKGRRGGRMGRMNG